VKMTPFSIRIVIVFGVREKFTGPELAKVMKKPVNRNAPFTTF